MTRMLKGILFDLDGTLVDSLRVTFRGFNEAWAAFGVAEKTPREIMAYFGPGERQIFENVLGCAEKAKTAEAYFLNSIQSRVHDVPLFEGVRDLIDDCIRMGIPIGIVTGRGRESTDIILKHHGYQTKFPVVICHEDVGSSKPSPEGIQKAMKLLGLAPETTAYIGDMNVDVRAAKRAGCTSVSVMWDSVYDHEAARREDPHHYFASPADLHAWIKSNFE